LSNINARSFSSMPGPRSAIPITILPFVLGGGDSDGRIGGRVLNGVLEELLDDLLDEFGVGIGGRKGGLDAKVDGAAMEGGLEIGENVGNQLFGVDRLFFEVDLAGFDARHGDDLGGELVEAVGFLIDDGEQFAVGLAGAGDQAGDSGFDGGERGFDVVGQGVEEGSFEDLALAGGLGVAGVFEGAGLFDGDGQEVGDSANHGLGGEGAEEGHAAESAAAEPHGGSGDVAGEVAGCVGDFGGGSEVVVGDGLGFGAGAEEFVGMGVIKDGGAAFEDLDNFFVRTRGWSCAGCR
jgi:hypothetical protein